MNVARLDLLKSKRHLSFSGLISRDATFQHMRAVRMQARDAWASCTPAPLHPAPCTLHPAPCTPQARDEWASGLTRWQPRRLRLQAPMTLTNLLPCAIHILVSEQGSVERSRQEAARLRNDYSV